MQNPEARAACVPRSTSTTRRGSPRAPSSVRTCGGTLRNTCRTRNFRFFSDNFWRVFFGRGGAICEDEVVASGILFRRSRGCAARQAGRVVRFATSWLREVRRGAGYLSFQATFESMSALRRGRLRFPTVRIFDISCIMMLIYDDDDDDDDI